MNSDEKLEMLKRYTDGIATPEERQQVETWFETTRLPQSEWEQMPGGEQQWYVQDMFGDIKKAIRTPEAQIVPLQPRSKWRLPAVAAAVLLLVAASWLFWPVHNTAPQLAVIKTASHLHYLQLPDSSKVWVNAGSQLKYPAAFTGKTREVYLSGEAYFDIRHEAAHPFIIHTGNVITTVLGTAFNIKEDPNTHQVTVTVKRGKVSVMAADQKPVVLLPDQQVHIDLNFEAQVTQLVNTNQLISWHGSNMQFDNSTFGDAVKQLEQHYGVPIKFGNDHLAGCRFTGTASADEALDEVLKVMCAFNHSTFSEQKDGSILISGTGCQ